MSFSTRLHADRRLLEATAGPVSFGDIVSARSEHPDTEGVLLQAAALGAEFFDLSTGVAGELLQKLTTYGIRAAIVDPDLESRSDRFRELALESRRSMSVFRITGDEEAALRFLAGSRSGCSPRPSSRWASIDP